MKRTFSSFFSFSNLRAVYVGVLGSAVISHASAISITEDFEDDPAHSFSWANFQNAAAMPGWTVFQNGTIPTSGNTLAYAFAGVSYSGAQALAVEADVLGLPVSVRRVSPLPIGGTAFAGAAVRLPQVSTAGNLLVPASILPSDAQLQLEGVRFAFITFGSGLAQWHYWNSSSATWLAIGPLTPVGAGVESLPNEWSRINIRRELASLNEADIWQW